MGSPGEGLSRDAPGNQTADMADHRLVRTDLDGQAGTRAAPGPAPFDVRRVDHPLGVVLILGGDLDLAAVPLLQEHLDRTMCSGADLVIDLAEVGFIDSSGLEVLVRADRQLRACGGQLVLLGASRAVYRVFELAGVDRYFAWSDSPSGQTVAELDRELGGGMRS
jgi:stage II sporulation protein AA (anti-sigma F factor antagonist)